MILKAENIKLISTNEKYMVASKYSANKRRNVPFLILSSKYKLCSETLLTLFRSSIDINKIVNYTSNVKVVIKLETYLDIDNAVKMIIDTICKLKVIKNDRVINELFIIKKPIKRGSPSNILVKIWGKHENEEL